MNNYIQTKMKVSNLLLATLFVIFIHTANMYGAIIKGQMIDSYGGIEHVYIHLSPTDKTTTSDSTGHFQLNDLTIGTYTLRFKGFEYEFSQRKVVIRTEDEVIDLGAIELKESTHLLDTVIINTGTVTDYSIGDSPLKVELIHKEYLEEVESYNLVEGIKTIGGVEEVISCGVCGTNDIHINGMEGRYTLVLIDGMPIVSSLASVYGLNGIPVSMIERIEIIKGPASAVYGSEAMGGVINVITSKAINSSKFVASTSFSSHAESNTSIGVNKQINKKTSALFSTNFFTNHLRIDKNEDNFTDFALGDRLSLFGKIERKDSLNKAFKISGRYYFEDRYGGVMNWEKKYRASDSIYGESILTHRAELVGHYDLPIKKNIFIDASYTYHNQNSYYGDVAFEAAEEVIYSTLTWNQGWKKHDFTTGLALRLNKYNDNTPATQTSVKQWIPGLFIQDFLKVNSKLTLLPGLRWDYQNEHGNILSPRISAKVEIGEWTKLRLSSGKGFKVVNLFTEDHAAISGTREVVIEEEIKPEESYNVNITLDHVLSIGRKGSGKITFDAFYNYFTNQIIPDYDTDPTKIIYSNLDFRSEAKGFSTNINYIRGNLGMEGNLTVQAVNELVKTPEGIERNRQLFTPNFTSNIRLRYNLPKSHSKITLNTKVVGSQELTEYDSPFTRPTKSKPFAQVDLKISRTFLETLQIGLGVKNLLNYTQDTPLVNPQQPYSDTFDTTYAYGPLQTRRFYISLKYSLK